MKRGDIYIANLDPTIGSEIQKTRTVLIVSNNANNQASNTITIVPITSNVTRVYPFEVLIEAKTSGLGKRSKAQCHQVRTISKLRLTGKCVGKMPGNKMHEINAALKLHLGLG